MGTAHTTSHSFLSFLFLLWIIVMQSQFCTATDTLSQSQKISVGDTLTSAGQIFELGFFRPGNSSRQYVGIWYKKISLLKVVWVANREEPIAVADSASSLTIGGDGNLRLVDGKQNIVWSTNISVTVNSSVAVLLDNGNLVLKDGVSGESLWESFNHPCDTALPGMLIGLNTRTGEKSVLTSWKMEDDPSSGKFLFGLSAEESPQVFVWNGSIPLYRSGQWNGFQFVGIPHTHGTYQSGFHASSQIQKDDHYFTFNVSNSSDIRIMDLTSNGAYRLIQWDEGRKDWNIFWNTLDSPCDIYGACGPFGVCTKNKSPICRCLKGFVPKSNEEWIKGNWTSGCVRRTELLCDKSRGNSSSGSGKIDGFWKFGGVKLPDRSKYMQLDNAAECQLWCLNNCSCLAYAYVTGIGCTIWAGNLLDIQEFSLGGGQDLFLRLANSELGKEDKRAKLIISFSVISVTAFLGAITYVLCKWKAHRRGKMEKRRNRFHFSDIFNTTRVAGQGKSRRSSIRQQDPSELPMFDLAKIIDATNNFSTNNKLGEGGFGPVFKGKLEDGQEIAVKKLSRWSGQGIDEFKNEIILISKLQHKNFVRLLGCCIEGEELLIVYEYMPNRSLDKILFDQTRRAQLDWDKRFNIIQGIARGLLYLHRDSCLKIIHRDLKVSNILLDEVMNPKISDFGLARTFRGTQELANTRRVVGTYGYMSPEYALGGIFSEKSDVFSFGVLLLEIVSGKKNTSFQNDEKHQSLVGYAWELWNDGRALDLLDQVLAYSFSISEVVRCIQVGLLCVQDNPADRPTMSAIVLLLSSETEGPQPKQPTFTFQRLWDFDPRSQCNTVCSINEVTVSVLDGR